MAILFTIGISKAERLERLPGAITSAKEMAAWGKHNNLTTVLITDEETPVTIDRIKSEFIKNLPANERVDLVIIHFAGHGFRSGAEQHIWLPTDWYHQMRGISVDGLKRQLYRHGISCLTIISDACRSLPGDIETAEISPDIVLPRGPYDPVAPIIDRFTSGIDGSQTFMLNADENSPARCVFSTVVMEGLSGNKEDAFDKYLTSCVIPESLALFVGKRIQEINQFYNINCTPEYTTGIPRDHAIYFNKGKTVKPLNLPGWPKPAAMTPQEKQDILRPSITIGFRTTDSGISPYFKNPKATKQKKLNYHDPSINLIVLCKPPVRIWTQTTTEVTYKSENQGAYRVAPSPDSPGASQLLLEFEDGTYFSSIIYEHLTTVVDRDGLGLLNWTCKIPGSNEVYYSLNSEQAVYDLQKGLLSSKNADDLAAQLRENKHVNPVLGAMASYLYDYNGDIDSIRRMAFFYCSHNQQIPFDVAYMGLLETNIEKEHRMYVEVPAVKARTDDTTQGILPSWVSCATPATKGQVAGNWPWLKQGWQFIEDPAPSERMVAERLSDVSQHLLPSQFSSFGKAGAAILIGKFNLENR